MPASTSSLTAFALAPGALNTGMPRLLSFATGMLLVPAPARATATTLVGNLQRVHVRRAHEDRVRVTDLGSHFVPIARQPLEAAHRDVVQRQDLE